MIIAEREDDNNESEEESKKVQENIDAKKGQKTDTVQEGGRLVELDKRITNVGTKMEALVSELKVLAKLDKRMEKFRIKMEALASEFDESVSGKNVPIS